MSRDADDRLFHRVEGEIALRYSPEGSDREFSTVARNISGGGIRFSLLEKLDPGTVLYLDIFKSNTDIKTRCKGRIVWMWDEPMDKENEQLFEAGIQFIERRLLYIGRLIEYLESQNRNAML